MVKRFMWKIIKNYPNYKISDSGECINIKTKKLLKPHDIGKGYLVYRLYKNSIQHTLKVHRLVAIAFIPNPNNYSYVNHKDENPGNNHVKNLEWCNHKYNCNYGTRNERMRKTLIKKYGVKAYIKELNLHFNCVKDCAKYLGIHSSNIFHQLKGRHNTCKGYKIIKEE